MAGTDSTRRDAGQAGPGPAIVLVEPQLGDNIGAAARAMLNCGLTDLRLVRPRDGWPNERAVAAASGADEVLDRVQLADSLAEAVADLQRVYAASARPRDMVKRVVTPRRAATDMREMIARDERPGVVFGPERSGLTNDDMALADTVLEVPLNPGFSSLNLAQAVLVVGYEWYQANHEAEEVEIRMNPNGPARPATSAELLGLFEHLEKELDDCGFLAVEEKRPSMVRNIRNLFHRADLMDNEVRMLRGIVNALVRYARPGDDKR